jgi:hypothetical protein
MLSMSRHPRVNMAATANTTKTTTQAHNAHEPLFTAAAGSYEVTSGKLQRSQSQSNPKKKTYYGFSVRDE